MAVKFIKRPLPKVLQTNILREFTVRLTRWLLLAAAQVLGGSQISAHPQASHVHALSAAQHLAALPHSAAPKRAQPVAWAWALLLVDPPRLQIQADLGFGHEHVIKAYEAVLTPSHLCLGGCCRSCCALGGPCACAL